MEKKYILVGAGGFGREVRAWLTSYSSANNVVGFVDDLATGSDVLGSVDEHSVDSNAHYIVCVGAGAGRIALGERLARRGAKIGAVISPKGAYISEISLTSGGIFLGVCSISSSVSIGKFLLVQGFACIGHDVVLEDGVTVSSHAFIGGGATIGRNTTIHPHATILPRLRIGRDVIIGAGAVVVKDVPDGVTVFGNPAKVIAIREPSNC